MIYNLCMVIFTLLVKPLILGQYERAYEMVDHLVKENEYKVTECRFIRAHIYKNI